MNDGFKTGIVLPAGTAAEIGPETADAGHDSACRPPQVPALAVLEPVSPWRRAQVAGYGLRPGRPVFASRGSTAGVYGFAALVSLSIALHFVAACTSPDCDARPGTAECGVEVVITATLCPGPREPDLAQNYIPIYAPCSSDDDCGAGRCQMLLGGPSRRMTFWNTVDTLSCYTSDAEWWGHRDCEAEPCGCSSQVKPVHCTTHFPDFLRYVQACAAVEESRGLNESCAAAADCEAGLVCILQFSSDPHPTELGYCGAPVPTACPCAATEECLPQDVCFEGICQPGRLAGESCIHPDACIRGTICAGYPGFCTPSSKGLGAPCSEHQDCMPKSLICRGGTCQNPFGEACVTDYQCGPGAACDDYPDWTGGGCWEYSCEWSWNDECRRDDGQWGRVYRKVPCTRPRCLPDPGTRPPGGSCWRDDDCEPSFVCRAGSCQIPGVLGDPCSNSEHCESGLFCSSQEGSTCQALRQPGQPCRESTECESGLRCNEGFVPARCHPPAESGERCASHSDCAAPLLCGRGNVGCGVLSQIGDPCLSSADCIPPSFCADGVCHHHCYPDW